jgi:hypothetical protein
MYKMQPWMPRTFAAASILALPMISGCSGDDAGGPGQASPYSGHATAVASGTLSGDGCDAALVEGPRVLATARCAEASPRVVFGEETRAITLWTVDRESALGELDRAPSSVTPLAVVPPRVGCGYVAAGARVCIDALASGALLETHGACATREGTPLVDLTGRLVGIALSADCTRFLSAFESLL